MPADHAETKLDAARHYGLEQLGIRNVGRVYCDPGAEQLIEHAIERHEGVLADNGALVVRTGHFTGRSPQDKFIVRDASTESAVDWGPVNQPISPQHFEGIYRKAANFLEGKGVFVENCLAGAD